MRATPHAYHCTNGLHVPFSPRGAHPKVKIRHSYTGAGPIHLHGGDIEVWVIVQKGRDAKAPIHKRRVLSVEP